MRVCLFVVFRVFEAVSGCYSRFIFASMLTGVYCFESCLQVYVANLRLKEVNTDVLVTAYEPVHIK